MPATGSGNPLAKNVCKLWSRFCKYVCQLGELCQRHVLNGLINGLVHIGVLAFIAWKARREGLLSNREYWLTAIVIDDSIITIEFHFFCGDPDAADFLSLSMTHAKLLPRRKRE